MKDLLAIALVGTQKNPVSPQTPDHAVERIIGKLEDLTPEHRLLVQAGIAAVRTVAGYEPRPVPALPAAPAESGLPPGDRLTQLLAQALSPDSLELLPEFVETLKQSGIHFPHSLVPVALDLVQPQRRNLLRPVLGERARWLAEHHAEWNWILEDTVSRQARLEEWERTWNEGTFAERLAALHHIRSQDSTRARVLLEPGFSKEKVEHRRKLLEVLRTQLSVEDLPFLEQVSRDRAEGVRQVARELLLQIPDSSISRRMRERAAVSIHGERDRSGTLVIQLQGRQPEDDDAERDGLADGIGSASGERGQFLVGLLGAIPPGEWTGRFACTAQELIAAIRRSEDAGLFLEGLQTAFLRFGRTNVLTVELFPDYWQWRLDELKRSSTSSGLRPALPSLLSAMPEKQRDRAVQALFASPLPLEELPVPELLQTLAGVWSLEFSELYLQVTRRLFQTRTDGRVYRWCDTLMLAATGLHPQCIPQALQPWTLHPELVRIVKTFRMGSVEDHLRRFAEVLKIRSEFQQTARQIADEGRPSAHPA